MRRRILVDISAHGYGHVAQTAPVVNAIFRRDLEIFVRSGNAVPGGRFECSFDWIKGSVDFGMKMKNAVDVDADETASSYLQFHENWEKRLENEAKWLESMDFDLVLCNAPYLPLKAASLAGIPSVSLCSLNWADLYRHYCSAFAGAGGIIAEMVDAYESASVFLKIEPALPMDWAKAEKIGPIGIAGKDRRGEIEEKMGLRAGKKLGLVSMGGMAFPIPFAQWPSMAGVHWLVPEEVGRPDMTSFGRVGMPFPDLIASSDFFVTKPGYGSFVEAAISGTPVLYLSRRDWPEEPCLVSWLNENGRCLEVNRAALEKGALMDSMESLLAMPEKPAPFPTGIDQAADILEALLT